MTQMTSTHEKVRHSPGGKPEEHTPASAADGVERALKILEGRWKLIILFHLFGGKVLRFSDLERTIPGISQKMLSQQLRQMEKDGLKELNLLPAADHQKEVWTDFAEKIFPAFR